MSAEPEAEASANGDAPSVDNRNVASDNAHVEQQIGIHAGDTTIHRDNYTYHVNYGDPPERRYEVARNFLDGGTPRRAQDMFEELLRSGWTSTERAYYYALSVLSDRSLTDLSGDLPGRIRDARGICSQHPPDEWSEALDAVWQLLCRVKHEYEDGRGRTDREPVDTVLRTLPPARQEEIFCHMDAVLRGLNQVWGESDLRERMIEQRTVPERAERSWKFFEAAPTEPKPFPPRPIRTSTNDWLRALAGAAGVLLGLFVLVTAPIRVTLLLDVVLLLAGGHLLVRQGVAIEAAGFREEMEGPGPEHPEDDAPPSASTPFEKSIGSMVDRLFGVTKAKKDSSSEDKTPGPHEEYRAYLKNRLANSHRHDGVRPANLRWLIEWHAQRADRAWGSDFVRTGPAVPSGTFARHRLGLALVVVGLLDVLRAQNVWALLLLSAGGWFAVRHGVRVGATRRANAAALAEAEGLHRSEMEAYRAHVADLADRPTDAQIARWHTLDKFYLVSDVINRVGLRRDQVIEYVVLTEHAPFARRGRVAFGPPRYSAYMVRILLLTRKGVRLARLRLDALTGSAQNEERFMFRYDAVVSARVTEKGTRTTTADNVPDSDVENLRSRLFRLVLSSGEAIEMKVNSFKSWQHSEDESGTDLIEAAYETSGIENALPILEAIAAEGEGWITHEQERRSQWSHAWGGMSVAG